MIIVTTENLSDQQKDIIAAIFFDSQNEEVTLSQLRKLANLKLITQGLLPIFTETELEQKSWEVYKDDTN